MKKTLLLVAIIPTFIFAQEQIHLTLFIKNAIIGDFNRSDYAKNQNQFLVIYSNIDEPNEFYMSNFKVKDKAKSYGKIYNIEVEEIPLLSEDDYAIKKTFLWDYKNSHDSNTGTANVELVLTTKNNIDFFDIKIFVENYTIHYNGTAKIGNILD